MRSYIPTCALVLLCLTLIASAQQPASPKVTILTPSTTGAFLTAQPYIDVSGTAASSSGIVRIDWSTTSGNSGTASGTTNWDIGSVWLAPGFNRITIKATDGAGGAATASLTVERPRTAAASAPDIRTGYLQGRKVTYAVVNGLVIYQGDIILGTPDLLENPTPAISGNLGHASIGVAHPSSLWPKVGSVYQVPYTITSGSSNVTTAISTFNSTFTGLIQFVPLVSQTDYVVVNLNAGDHSGTCESTSVGRAGGAQSLGGSIDCTVGTLLHEFGHAIGLWHEQSRPDRDNFVSVMYNNVIKASRSNFDRVPDNVQVFGLYDYGSIMHYYPFAFSRNGGVTVESIPAGIPLSNQTGYTAGDIDGIKRLYNAAPTQVTIATNPPGLQVSVDSVTVTTPQTFTWALNSVHTLDIPNTSVAGNPAYTFARWNNLPWTGSPVTTNQITVAPGTGLLASPATSATITVYTANFIQLVPVQQPATVFPSLSGSVAVSPTPLTYSGLTGSYYTARQQVTFTATPNTGYQFYSWFGISTDGPVAFGMNPLVTQHLADGSTLQGGFTNTPMTTVTTSPSLLGVQVDGSFYYAPNNFASQYNGAGWANGTSHSIFAYSNYQPYSSDTRYNFGSWSDSGANPHNIVVQPSGATLTASMNAQYRVTANVTLREPCAGSVALNPPSPTMDNFYSSGTPVTFTETPNSGWLFTHWLYDLTGTANPQTLTVNDEELATADYNTVSTPLSVTSLVPSFASAGGAGFTMTVYGTGFTPSSIVFVNNTYSSGRTVTFLDSTRLSVQIFASDIASAGAFQIGVSNFPSGAICSAFATAEFFVSTTAISGPTGGSVSPASGSGLSQTFTFKYSSQYGSANLRDVYALFNASVNGAGACFVLYDKPTNGFYLYNDAGNGITGPLTPGGGGTLANSQCTLNGSGSSIAQLGNTLTMVLSLTFTTAFGGTQNVFLYSGDNDSLASGWQTRGAWTVPAGNTAPTADSVAPSSGSGLAQSFTLKYSSANGSGYLKDVYVLFNTAINGAGACFVIYDKPTAGFYLYNDAGNGVTGPLAPGAASTLSNGQCTLTGTGSSVAGASNTLTVVVNLTFNSSFGGAQTIFMYAADNGGIASGWQNRGSWTVPASNTPPTADSVNPASGSALTQSFTFKYSSANGFGYLNDVYALFQTAINGANACFVVYDKASSAFYLYNNAGSGLMGPLAPGAGSSLSNSQCTLTGTGSSVSGAGNTLTMVLNLTFNGSFAGTKTTWMYALDKGGFASGWQNRGSWNVP